MISLVAAPVGVLVGMGIALQTGINSVLRKNVVSPLLSSFVSFGFGSILLILLIFVQNEPLAVSTETLSQSPWWQWFGGLLGAIYIGGIVLIVPQIGTGGAIVTSLFGLLVGSLLIDQFGLLGATKKPINCLQIIGLLVLLAGVVIIQISK